MNRPQRPTARSRATSVPRTPRGVALLIILAVLTILTIIAATMVALSSLELKSSQSDVAGARADLLLNAGLAHASALLTAADRSDGGFSWLQDRDTRAAFGISLAPQKATVNGESETYGTWFPITDSAGSLYGRYRMRIEDEGGKVNVSKAAALEPSRGSGWDAAEIHLPQALGIPAEYSRRFVDYRYGPNGLPGARGDDDNNNIRLMNDGIDNNGNGLIDEEDEGVDDPQEYNSYSPRGDDRTFTSISDMLNVILTGGQALSPTLQRRLMNELPRRATLFSHDIPGSATLPNDAPSDINAVTVRECRARLRTAHSQIPFEGNAKRLDELASNMVDYRDQNDVLSTIGSAYGVEAVCFSELLANEGSEFRYSSTCLNQWFMRTTYPTEVDSEDFVVSGSSLFHEFRHWIPGRNTPIPMKKLKDLYYMFAWDAFNHAREGCWDVEIESPTKIRLLGPGKKRVGETFSELWDPLRLKRWDEYKKMRKQIGSHLPFTHDGNPGFMSNSPPAYETFEFPPDFFKYWYIAIGYCKPDTWNVQAWDSQIPAAKILNSSKDGVLTIERIVPKTTGVDDRPTRAILCSWETLTGAIVAEPNIVTHFTVRGLKPNKYYIPRVNGYEGRSAPRRTLGFGPYERVIGDNRERMGSRREWQYGGDGDQAIPIRPSIDGGCADVYLKSGNNCTGPTGDNGGHYLKGFTFVRPEVMELINVSPRAISLKNWTLTFNSGSFANDIGIIRSASGYSSGDSTQANPTIASNGYFYCVNNLRLFNAEFGTGSVSPWGRNPGQTVPAWEIPSDSWGVQYKIRKVGTDTTAGKWEWVRIYTSNERFRRDQFVGEIVEFCDTIHSPQRATSANGSRYKVYANGPNWFELRQYTLAWEAGRFDPQNRDGCDTLMIVGMPAKGGVVSMTLKNQYNQITSRTVDYAFLNDEIRNWFGRSVEKVDPTHYTWVVRRRPSFGGKPADARNSSTRNMGVQANVKNGPYNSVTEVQYVRKGEDFENVGAGSKSGSGARTMASLASFFGNSHIRLEAMDADVTGWKIAYDSVANAIRNGVNAGRGGWEDDQWKGQRIRFMTGPLRGETFPVTGNSRNTVSIYDSISAGAPRSTPSGVSFRPNDDDLFALGPGYTTPFSYTRRSNDEGVFTWRGCVQAPASYELYLFGLNDAINTTEFLEENNNSPLDVSVWNYVAERFDPLCSREKYDKDDCIHAGTVKPEHISPQGDVKMRLVSHDVVEDDAPGQSKDGRVMTRSVRRRSGYAWFNYALLTPAPVIGRVNVNTASARLLRSLPGVTDTLAANIAAGVDSHGVPSLKPYRRLGDLLSVRGMSVAALERMANLVMLQSDAYTIAVEAQAVRDVNRNGAFDDASDAVTAERRMRYIVRMRHGGPELPPVQLLEKTRL